MKKRYTIHPAVVEWVGTDRVTVSLESTSYCDTCGASRSCLEYGNKRHITVLTNKAEFYHVGDHVTVSISNVAVKMAYNLAFTIPVALVVVGLVAMHWFKIKDTAAAALILFVVADYFVTLYLILRNQRGRFKFKLSKPHKAT